MQIPKAARRKARELFDSALDAKGRPDASKSVAVADLLVKSAPRHALQILKEYTRLIRLASARHHAVIESAVPLYASTFRNGMAARSRWRRGWIPPTSEVSASVSAARCGMAP